MFQKLLGSAKTAVAEPIRSEFCDEEDFHELLEFFIGALPERFASLQQAWADEDIAQLRTISHQLKGAGAGYGFPGLSEKSAALEAHCKNEDYASIHESLKELLDYMDLISL